MRNIRNHKICLISVKLGNKKVKTPRAALNRDKVSMANSTGVTRVIYHEESKLIADGVSVGTEGAPNRA
jgi:hypothetical protein